MNQWIKEKYLLIATTLILIEGGLFTAFYTLEPSSAKNAWLGGLSRDRLLIDSLMVILLIFLTWQVVTWIKAPVTLEKAQNGFVHILENFYFRQSLLVSFGLLFILAVFFLILVWTGNPGLSSFFISIFEKIIPLAIWIGLSGFQGLVLLGMVSARQIQTRFTMKEIFCGFFVILAGVLCVAEWITLTLHLEWPILFKQFVWVFTSTHFFPLHYILVSGLALFAVMLLFLPHTRKWQMLAILALVICAYIIQLILPITGFDHLNDTLERYKASPISHIIYSVCAENPGYSSILRQYDSLLGNDFWLGTKPPGYILFYTILRDVSALSGSADCATILPIWILLLFPLLAALSLLPLAGLAHRLNLFEGFPLAGMLLFFMPNMLFFSLIADQAIYPLLFTLTLWLTVETTHRSNWHLAFLLGMLLYLDVLMSFSLLPLLGFVGLWFLLSLINTPSSKKPLLKLVFCVALGFGCLYLAFLAAGGYNVWVRYQNAFSSHRAIKPVYTNLDFFTSIFLNSFEFVYWTGFPVCLLALTGFIFAIRHPSNRQRPLAALFALSFGGMIIVLNLVGQTRGEVGRLWLFLAPCMALLAGYGASKWPRWLQIILVLAQGVTVLCIFQAYYIP